MFMSQINFHTSDTTIFSLKILYFICDKGYPPAQRRLTVINKKTEPNSAGIKFHRRKKHRFSVFSAPYWTERQLLQRKIHSGAKKILWKNLYWRGSCFTRRNILPCSDKNERRKIFFWKTLAWNLQKRAGTQTFSRRRKNNF